MKSKIKTKGYLKINVLYLNKEAIIFFYIKFDGNVQYIMFL